LAFSILFGGFVATLGARFMAVGVLVLAYFVWRGLLLQPLAGILNRLMAGQPATAMLD